MKWPASRPVDRAFGPRFPNEFDFTLYFEHTILTLAPSLIFLLIALCYIMRLYRRPSCARSGALSWVKLVRFNLASMPGHISFLNRLVLTIWDREFLAL